MPHRDPERKREVAARWYQKNKEKLAPKMKETSARWHKRTYVTIEGRAKSLLWAAKKRATQFKVPYDLTLDWLLNQMEMGVCAVSGVTLDLTAIGGPTSPSLDRIEPSLGYVPHNCRITSAIYNLAKNKWTDADVAAMAAGIISKLHQSTD